MAHVSWVIAKASVDPGDAIGAREDAAAELGTAVAVGGALAQAQLGLPDRYRTAGSGRQIGASLAGATSARWA